MKYYSEKLKKVFDTVEELESAEKSFDKANQTKEQKEKEIKDIDTQISELNREIILIERQYHDKIRKVDEIRNREVDKARKSAMEQKNKITNQLNELYSKRENLIKSGCDNADSLTNAILDYLESLLN